MKGSKNLNLLIIVSALGYFVDVYDLLLFGVVKAASLTGIGITNDQLSVGITLTNYQVIGLVVGGIIWGVLGDKRGRLSVLFGSILLYSIANIGNAFIHDIAMYKVCRFIAGVGLAGELGAGITLVMETNSNRKTNYGPQIITGFGLLGAVMAGVLGQMLEWRTTYLIGGIMGLVLLLMRLGWVKKSIELENKYYNNDTYAALLYKIGNKQEAINAANKAIELGKKEGQDVTSTQKMLIKIKAMK